jgi:hypothetical protein
MANAVTVSGNDGTFDIEFIDGTYNVLSTTLMAQLWWDSRTGTTGDPHGLAFSNAVDSHYGLPRVC